MSNTKNTRRFSGKLVPPPLACPPEWIISAQELEEARREMRETARQYAEYSKKRRAAAS